MSQQTARAPTGPTPIEIEEGLRSLQREVAHHKLQSRLSSFDAWKIFMEHHIFAVWDFMTLLKRLQRDLTCVTLPWRPAKRPEWARLINDIVLEEETDEDGRGGHRSHFELYLEAMEDVGADTASARKFIALLEQDYEPVAALDACGAPAAVRPFVKHTLDVALHAPILDVAAVFLWGRESLLPNVFTKMLPLAQAMGHKAKRLAHYLERHIELDGGSHGPAAENLIAQLARSGGIERAQQAARAALEARMTLFDGIEVAIRDAAG